MRRQRFRKPTVTLSLFPFLAVLVCTMGALIVLLVCVLQQARLNAEDVAQSRSTEAAEEKQRLEDLRMEKEDQEWRRSELERQRTEFQQQLSRQRLTLSHFEDHIRNLEEQLKRLSTQAQDLVRIAADKSGTVEERHQKLQALTSEIQSKRQELAETQRKAATRKRTFAIIPYAGPNGTKRRPIYIECTDQGIVLQPEGVVLSPDDFTGMLGPGNPLDAALRTTREYLAKYGSTGTDGEPYPLLIVRPNGTVAYAAARAALKSWDDEFGYELVEADLELAYPKPDPTLAQELQRSIADARQRQDILAAMMPGRYRQSGTKGLVASSSGGFTAVGGSTNAGGTGSGLGPNRGGVEAGGGSFTRTFQDASLGAGDRATSMQAAQRSANGNSGGAGTNARMAAGSKSGKSGGLASNPTSASGSSGTAATPFGMPGMPGATQQIAENATTANSSTNASSPGGSAQQSSQPQKAPASAKPLANQRGADWGLPNRTPTATGIQRYVQVECTANELILHQDRTDYRNPKVIPMTGATAEAVDPFISALWKRMEQWGLAADGCYWKPVLRVHVQPDGEQRFAELSALLEYSGIVLERKN